ncbi:MAG: hypothetical protein JWO36_1075 [Myxococcales bacterium]|nr:hypothetical protein [Myxococcales bacterium]
MQRRSGMTDNVRSDATNPQQPAAGAPAARDGGTTGFARRHPALTVIGAAGLGLIGGIELAAGVLIGAGVAALLRRPDGREVTPQARQLEERAHTLADRVPHEVRQRARAIVQAARGQLHPSEQRPGEHVSDPTIRH